MYNAFPMKEANLSVDKSIIIKRVLLYLGTLCFGRGWSARASGVVVFFYVTQSNDDCGV